MFSHKVPAQYGEVAKQMDLPFTTPNSLNATTIAEYLEKTVNKMGAVPTGEAAGEWVYKYFWFNTPPNFHEEITQIIEALNIIVTDEDDEEFEDEAMDELIEEMLYLYVVYR